ncbi:MAG: 1-acyl-sn-glycerol-3-phosphate acyltransferase [Oscillospiraceae bacterium]|nr:1-acyl-sn-glycerol-3-phosphate acyltransferase [Oscillospiraceae bacterium]
MLVKIMAVLSLVLTALTASLTGIAGSGAALIWIIPLMLLGFFLAANVVYALVMLIATELLINLKKPNDNPKKFWNWNLEAIADWLKFWGRIKVHCIGFEKLPEGRFLMVCNHRSFFDPIVKIPELKSMGMNYVSKPGNFRIPIAGKLMHAYGCLSLNRDNNREALVTIKRATELITGDVSSICIYPEGTRSVKNEMLPFHAGSFKCAQKAGCPVVMAAVFGTDLIQKNFPFKPSHVYIEIIDVIDSEFVKSHKTNEVAELAQTAIQKKYDELAKRSSANA